MRMVLTVPNEILLCLQAVDKTRLYPRLLELLAIEGYQNDFFTQRHVMMLLGFTQREELWAFFEKNRIRGLRTLEDL